MQMVLLHVNGLTCDGCFHEEGLSLKVLCKVTWIPRESVDHLVARVCVDVIRYASE